MSKSLNFAFQWIGPKGPITNNRVPTIIDLVRAQFGKSAPGDLLQDPHFYEIFGNNANLVSCHKIPKGNVLYELNFSTYHYRNWRKMFSINDGPFSDQLREPGQIDYLLANNGYFLITILFEGWVHNQLFDELINFFTHYNIPLDRVIYVTNCSNANEMYNAYCEARGIDPLLNVEYIPTCRIHQTGVEEPLRDRKTNPYVPGPRKKDFLCFQRRWSDHRLVFFLSMWRKGLLDNFYMSMSNTQPESGASFKSNIEQVARRHPKFKITDEEVVNSEQVLPLILDTTNFDRYPMESSANDVEQYYKDSMINIISETNFFTPEIHLNEKTYKPIAFKQPFIMMSAPYSLQHLKDVGFKTFDKWWNEGYDKIVNNDDRMEEINRIVEEISNWTDEKKVQFTHEVKDIVEYNCEHLATMSHPEVKHFEEKYGN